MNYQPQNYPLTIEGLMASIEASNRYLTEKQAETDRFLKEQSAEFNKRLKEEAVEFDRKRKEESAEYDRKRKEENAEYDRKRKEENAAYEKRMKRMDEEMGRWSNNQGCFAEEYFYNSFDYGRQNFFGEEFDVIKKNLNVFTPKLEDEYDIVLYNHTSVAIIETKYKAHIKDVPKVLKKAETFRILCPDFKDFKIYLGLASMAFYPELEEKCKEEGIVIIKQVGDTVVIDDGHLKVF